MPKIIRKTVLKISRPSPYFSPPPKSSCHQTHLVRLPPPAGLFHLPTRFCYFAFILLPEHILQPFCHQTHLVRLPLLRRAFPTHFILHIFPIIFLPVTLSPNNFATKCGSSALAPAPQGFPPQSHRTHRPQPRRFIHDTRPLTRTPQPLIGARSSCTPQPLATAPAALCPHDTRPLTRTPQPLIGARSARNHTAPHDHLSVAPPLHPRHGAAPYKREILFSNSAQYPSSSSVFFPPRVAASATARRCHSRAVAFQFLIAVLPTHHPCES